MNDKYTYILIYAFTLIVGLLNYKKYNQSLLLKLWLYFLIYSFLTEVSAVYVIYTLKIRAYLIYNIWNIVNTLFYLLFFSYKIKILAKKRLVFGLILIYILFITINVLFYKNIRIENLNYSAILGMFFIVFTIMVYYTELLNSDSILKFQKSLFFWLSVGVLVINIGSIPVFVIGELIDWQGIFNYIILVLNLLMATFFITGFVVSKKELNT